MESFLILILVSFCLPSCVPQGVFTVDRRIFRPSSSDKIQTSQDIFTNLHGSVSKSCAQYNKSYCSDQNCASCKCDFGYTFFDLKDGCLNAEQIYAKNTQAVSCKFGFSRFTSKTSVPTVVNGKDFHSFPKQISWSPLTTARPFSLQSTVDNVRCRAGKISYVNRLGELVTFYENEKSDAFEIQDTSISTSWFTLERSYFHQLRWNQAGSVLWDQMRGKLIRLHVTCQRSNPPLLTHSCILMKVSGKGDEALPTGSPSGSVETTPVITQPPATFTLNEASSKEPLTVATGREPESHSKGNERDTDQDTAVVTNVTPGQEANAKVVEESSGNLITLDSEVSALVTISIDEKEMDVKLTSDDTEDI